MNNTLPGIGAELSVLHSADMTLSAGIFARISQVYAPDDHDPASLQGKLLYAKDEAGNDIVLIACTIFPDVSESIGAVFQFCFEPDFLVPLNDGLLANKDQSFKRKSKEQLFSIDTFSGELQELFTGSLPAGPSMLLGIKRLQLALAILSCALTGVQEMETEEEVPACRFLAYDSEREKILEACSHIEKRDGKPYTIRELSRKVAMNECYLKKGFKALTGKTIHEYQQDIRIGRAKEMLQVNGMSVTDVALSLGYSSISHFSTAFKRVTGLKPCELLA